MLPFVSAFFRDNVEHQKQAQNQPEIQKERWKNIGSSISNRLQGFANPSLMMQQATYRTLGTNVVGQGAVQLGGLLKDIIGKSFGGTESSDSYNVGSIDESGDRRSSKKETEILREILKTLLRIDKNIEEGDGGIGSTGKKKFDPFAKQKELDKKNDRKSAEDLLSSLEQKNPLKPKTDEEMSNLQQRLGNISGNVESQALQGVYNAFGYNVVTQTATELGGFAVDTMGDLLKKIGKPMTSEFPYDIPGIDSIGNGKSSGITGESAIVEEQKKETTLLSKILDRVTELNQSFKKFFNNEPISELESSFESIDKKVPQPAMPGELLAQGIKPPQPEQVGLSAAEMAAAAAGGEVAGSLLSKTLSKGKGLMGALRSGFSFLSRAALPAAAAAAPLSAMYGVKEWVEDTEHDEERVEATKSIGDKISDFMKSFGLDFEDRFEKQRAKNREGLDMTDIETNPSNKAQGLTESADKLDSMKTQSKSESGSTTNIANTNNVKNQTIIPSVKGSKQTDSSVNRYFDNSFK